MSGWNESDDYEYLPDGSGKYKKYNWKEFRKTEIKDFWLNISGMGLCTICPRCSGSSISRCPCAFERFMNSFQNEQEFDDYVKDYKNRNK